MAEYKTYPTYKDSKIQWLGEIPEHWKLKRIKFLFKIEKRIAGELGHKVLSITQKGIKIKDIESGGGQLSMDYSKYQLVKIGDFAMNHMDLLTGYVDVSKYNGVISPDYRVFSLFDKNSDSKFFLYLFQMGYWDKLFFHLGQGSSQLGRWRLATEEFNLFKMPQPPLSEQTAIANFLDRKTREIAVFIALKEKTIALLKERKTAIINKAVTKGLDDTVPMKDSDIEWLGEIPAHWEVKKLKNICDINNNSLSEDTNRNLKIRYVDIGSISSEFGILHTEEYYFRNAPSRARRRAKYGDTVISMVRTYLKAIDFIDEEKSELIYSTGFAVLQPKYSICPKYLTFIVKSNAFTDQVTVNSKGMSYPAINSSDLGKLIVLKCGTEEQNEIVKHIESNITLLNSTIAQAEKEISLIKEYQQNLISEAVTGKIDVSEMN